MSDCLFCKIAQGEINSDVMDVMFEDADIKVFKDIHPKAPVHLLVIPKIHIQSIAHLDPVRSQPRRHVGAAVPLSAGRTSNGVEVDHCNIVVKLIYTAKEVAQGLGLSGYKLVFNVGKEGGQVIDHLHLHILGGWGSMEGKRVDV